MELGEIFGKTFACECGRTHEIEPREVIYSEDALSRLPSLCAEVTDGRKAAVLMDVRTRGAAGAAAAEVLSSDEWNVTEVIVPDPAPGGSPVCDDITKDALTHHLGTPDVILTVGAGVITDLGKWLGFEGGVLVVTLATAASMNGYTSANVAPTIQGVKTLLRARAPAVVLSTPEVLRDAPFELTGAGLGDVLAKSVSSADWYLNHVLFGDYYCPRSVSLIAEIEPMYLENPEAVHQRAGEAVQALFQALLLTGAAMTMAESSSPASGGEHLISHALDMMSSLDGKEHDLHGRQVGVGTVLMAELYRRVLAVESPQPVEAPEGIDSEFWGPLGNPVREQYTEKLPRLRDAKEKLSDPRVWDRLRADLRPMLRPPETIRDCLRSAAAAYRAEDISCDPRRLVQALVHAHEIRSRFTILDVGYLLGVLPDAASDIVEQWG